MPHTKVISKHKKDMRPGAIKYILRYKMMP